jgi:polyhydroxybutyrate depolymerase
MIVVHPDGYQKTWNGVTCCGAAVRNNIDDVQFVRDMLDQVLIPKYCVDAKRVYATGLSNGAFLAHRLACELSDRIAAIVSVAGLNGTPACPPRRAVSVLHIHGTADAVIPYARALPTVQGWANRNGCTRGPEETFRNRDAHCDTWSGCNGGTTVTFCTIDDLGHRWPGSTGVEGAGAMSADISAGSFGADFMLHYSLP